jgi:peptidoglycan/xylan/chitin deacetylase (PgdA/CDA1 family)
MNSILSYHSISKPAEPMPGEVDVSPENFEQQLIWIACKRTVVPISETLMARSGMTAVTFDDGFRDNLTRALPLLERYQIPATFFITAGYIGRVGYLTGDDVRELGSHPLVTIGAHGLWHRHFTQLSKENARNELVESKRLLEHLSRQPVEFMSWPYDESNDRLERLSAECGFRASWSGWKASDSQYSYRRVPVLRGDNIHRFIAKVKRATSPVELAERKLSEIRNRTSLSRLWQRGVVARRATAMW